MNKGLRERTGDRKIKNKFKKDKKREGESTEKEQNEKFSQLWMQEK